MPDESPWQLDLSWKRAQDRVSVTKPWPVFQRLVSGPMLPGMMNVTCDPQKCDWTAPILAASCHACLLFMGNRSSIQNLRLDAKAYDATTYAEVQIVDLSCTDFDSLYFNSYGKRVPNVVVCARAFIERYLFLCGRLPRVSSACL